MRDIAATATAQAYAPPADVLAQMGVRMTFARDEEIYAQEEEADLVYQVVSGAVRTTRLMADGRRQIGDFYYPGEFFGLEPGGEHRFSAEALIDSVILVIRKSAARAIAERDGNLQQLLWSATTKELQRAQDHLLLLGRKTACEKVASFLKDMVTRQAGRDQVTLPMGRQDMADYLGLTIETVSRMLTQLQGSATVELIDARHFRVANTAALERLAA